MSAWSGIAVVAVAFAVVALAVGQPLWEWHVTDGPQTETWSYGLFTATHTVANETTGASTVDTFSYPSLTGQSRMASLFLSVQYAFLGMVAALIAAAALSVTDVAGGGARDHVRHRTVVQGERGCRCWHRSRQAARGGRGCPVGGGGAEGPAGRAGGRGGGGRRRRRPRSRRLCAGGRGTRGRMRFDRGYRIGPLLARVVAEEAGGKTQIFLH